MKMIRDTTGRFASRPHYEVSELDHECEQIVSTFLMKRYGAVKYPVSTDDLTSLIEKETEDLDHYADLSQYGAGVEGVTLFQRSAKPKVKIAAFLSEGNRENRLRTTLTHEYGHVHFHSFLFDQTLSSMDLFAGDTGSKTQSDLIQVCKRDTILNSNAVDWMEWQAGHVCGAILMPANALRALIKAKFLSVASGEQSIDTTTTNAMVEEIQGAFQVSAEAARVRLERLSILRNTVRNNALF